MEILDGYSSDLQPRRPGSIPRIAGPSPTPNLPAQQVPWYTPETPPQLEGPSPIARLIGPSTSQVPAQQVPFYNPESVPRIAAPAEAPPPSAGPLSRAASMAPAAGAAGILAGGAAATAAATGAVAANPEYFQKSIGDDGLAANILLASQQSQPPQKIADVAQTARTQNGPLNVPVIAQAGNAAGGGRGGAAGDWVAASNPAMPDAGGGRGFINPPNAIADVARASTAPQYDDRFRTANLTNMQNEAYRDSGDPIGDIIRQKLAEQQGQGGAQPPADGGNGSFLPVGAQSGGQPPQAPISFATYGGGTESSKAYRADGTATDLKAGQPLPADVQQFNRLSQQAGQEPAQPVQVIRALTPTMAMPTEGGPMREASQAAFDAGKVPEFFAAQAQNALNAADPLAAKTASEVAVKNAENKGKTDAAQIAADAHLKAAQLQYESGKVPAGFQRTPDGKGVVPIPGSEAAQKDKDRLTHAQSALAANDTTVATIDRLLTHPGREGATGTWNYDRFIPGTKAADFGAELETLKAQTFLPMVEQMKGLGALSDAEGKKLSAAIGALDPKMSEEGFVESLNRIKANLGEGRNRLVAANPGLTAKPGDQTGAKQNGAAPSPAAPGNKAASVSPSIPEGAIAHLRSNPALKQAFEAKYGVSADSYLGQ
jgi:hypothetical protein